MLGADSRSPSLAPAPTGGFFFADGSDNGMLFFGTEEQYQALNVQRPKWPRLITSDDEVAIIKRYREGGVTQTALAEQYSVSQSTISRVIQRFSCSSSSSGALDVVSNHTPLNAFVASSTPPL